MSFPDLTDGTVRLADHVRDGDRETFTVVRDGAAVGTVELHHVGAGTGRLVWRLGEAHRGRGSATRALRLLTDWAMTETGQGGRGLGRVEARVPADNRQALGVATRAGLLREGVSRLVPGHQSETEQVLLARMATDPPLSDPSSFRALLNSFLPRKRAIGQLLVRDPEGRVLLCHLTYKRDWDLPGGVVEVGESPKLAVTRELEEELGLELPAGELLLTDWLPPWGGWDDAVCLVFDGGVHEAALLDRAIYEAREIREARFLTLDEIRDRAADFTARRIEAALAALDGGPGYTESGRA
ncbi:NUDIX hydrolase [Nocardioides alcanivorans]|uniref:NUDIX hydrolase n=1 Tax=Nocardioides alcanivorans TaxID=2897352 RepID=UPI001F428343|nr:GNAT family N-acetyltransferase [Nocardioides alcanivorans]